MSKIRTLFFLVLAAGFVFSLTLVNNCQNLSTSGETYILNTDLDDAGDRCFNITNEDIVFACNGKYIDGTGPGGGTAVYNSGYNGTTIENCTIQEFDDGMYFNNAFNISLTNISVSSINSKGLYFDQTYGVNLNGMEGTGGNGRLVYFTDSENVSISDVYFYNADTGIHVEDSYNLTIQDFEAANLSGATDRGMGILVNGVELCEVSDISVYNTSSLAVYLWDISDCDLHDVVADYGSYSPGNDGFVSVHGPLGYFDPAPNTNVWNIEASRSYANATNLSGCIGVSVSYGTVENITAHDCKMSGIGTVLGNASTGRNFLAYNNGMGGVVLVAGLENLSSIPFAPAFPVLWDPEDEGPAEAYDITAYGNGWIGTLPVVMNHSNITNVQAYNTGQNYWDINLTSLCDPFGIGFCLNLTNDSRFAGSFVGLSGTFINSFMAGDFNASEMGTLRNAEFRDSPVGLLILGVAGAELTGSTIHDNTYAGVWINNSIGVLFNDTSIYSNGGDGVSMRPQTMLVGVLMNNSEVYGNGGNGISLYNSNSAMTTSPTYLVFDDLSIHSNGGDGIGGQNLSFPLFVNVSIYSNTGSGINLEAVSGAAAPPADSFVLVDCYDNREYGLSAGQLDINISHSSFHGNGLDGIKANGMVTAIINNSEVYGNTGHGISFRSLVLVPTFPSPTVINTEIHNNGENGIVLGAGGTWMENASIHSNSVGVELTNPSNSYTRGGAPFPYGFFFMRYSFLEGNTNDVEFNFPNDDNVTAIVGAIIQNTTFGNTNISLAYTTNETPIDLSLDSRTSMPGPGLATYDPLYRFIDIESSTGEVLNQTAIHYTPADAAGRNQSNLEVLEYDSGTWSVVANQTQNGTMISLLAPPAPTRGTVVFYNHSTFSTFGLFENSTDYKPSEDERDDGGRDKLRLDEESSGYTLDNVLFTVTSDGHEIEDARVHIKLEGEEVDSVVTNDDGMAVFVPVAAGLYSAYAAEGGYKDSNTVRFEISLRQLDIELPPSPMEDEGFNIFAYWQGSPVEGATISIAGLVRETGESGDAIFTLPAGNYPVYAAAEGYEEWEGSLKVSEVTEEETVPEPPEEEQEEEQGGVPEVPPEQEPEEFGKLTGEAEVPSVEEPKQPVTEKREEIQQEYLWIFLLLVLIGALTIYLLGKKSKGKAGSEGKKKGR
ncbi:MAG: right-handed parallel beta-helix repeat-containing protein [Candidatus Micrarchaeia archaeon]